MDEDRVRQPVRAFEWPPDKNRAFRRGLKVEWLTIAYLVVATGLLFAVLGGSQAMKAEMFEKGLSLTPPLAFLVASRFRDRPPNRRFPWGYHRAVSLAYLASAAALIALGSFVLIDSLLTLLAGESAQVGTTVVLGVEMWTGWLQLAVLAVIVPPPILLARRKLPIAAELHDKVLYADGDMNKADWQTTAAAMVGVAAVGIGVGWGDAAAATVIALSILRDGWRNLSAAGRDLMDATPRRYDGSREHPLVQELEDVLEEMDWILDAEVRLREQGHVFVGEVLVAPIDDRDLGRRCLAARETLMGRSWKLHDIVVAPLPPERQTPDEADEQDGR